MKETRPYETASVKLDGSDVCVLCGQPAACFGRYYGLEAGCYCADCCSHSNEDGHCELIDEALN